MEIQRINFRQSAYTEKITRTVYTINEALAEIGGFFAIVQGLLAFVLSRYQQINYNADMIQKLYHKVNKTDSSKLQIDLAQNLESRKKIRIIFCDKFKALMGCPSFILKRGQNMLESDLDVISLLENLSALKLMFQVFLSKHQRLLIPLSKNRCVIGSENDFFAERTQ